MRNSPLLPIFLIVAVDVLGLTIVLPLLPFYAEHYGASATVVGLIGTSFAFAQLVSGPILGKLSDRFGRRPLLILSQIGTLIGFLILAFANSLPLIFLGRIIDGFTAGNLSIAQAYISDVTEPENRAKAFGVIGVAFGLGFLIGPAISGFLSKYGYHYPILASAALSFISILATYFLLKEDPTHRERRMATTERRLSVSAWGTYVEYFRRPELGRLLWQFFCFVLAFSIFISGFALFLERRFVTASGRPYGAEEVGYLFAFSGFLGLIIQGGLVGRLVKKMGEAKLATVGFLSAMVGYAIVGFSYKLPVLIFASVFSSFGSGVLRPALTSSITRKAGKHEQGTILGLTQSLNSVSQIAAPLLAGPLIDHGMLTVWALLAAVVYLIGFLLSLETNSLIRSKCEPSQ